MSEAVLKVDNVSKKFCRTLKNLIKYGSLDIARDFLGIETRTDKLRKGEFWAVDEVSFELKKGEALGLIGVNGSGKTTLLKMINGIFMPDKGKITAHGRMGAMIAVGVGFHPLLTGRENIYVNGQIIGMSKEEINKKLDAIIDFAEIEESIDAPVKHFSSGMLVRLGFSVAVHSEPDILLIDEVLAVGDISFRKKCMDRMEQLRNKTSIIFVSHNMYQVERLCERVLLLDKGKILGMGNADDIVNKYHNLTIDRDLKKKKGALNIVASTGDIENFHLRVMDRKREEKGHFQIGEDIIININFSSYKEFLNPIVGIAVINQEGIRVTEMKNIHLKENKYDKINKGRKKFEIIIENSPFIPGIYKVLFVVKMHNGTKLFEAVGQRFAIESKDFDIAFASAVKVDWQWVDLPDNS